MTTPTPVLKTDTFEIWRRKTNVAITSLTDIATEINESAYLDDQFRLETIEGTKAGFLSGKVRNRSEVFEVNPLTTLDSFTAAGAGPYNFVVSADLMTEDTITVTNTTTLQVLPDTSYSVNYTTNTITITNGVADTENVDIEVVQKYIVLNFSAAADGVHNIYVDCSGTPQIEIGAIPDVAFPTTPVIPLYRVETSGSPSPVITQNTDYPEDLRTWASVAVDPSVITTGKIEYREVLLAPASDVTAATLPTSLYSDSISVYVNGIRQSQEGTPPDYVITDDAGFIKVDFSPTIYPVGTDILVVATEDDHNVSVVPKYSIHVVTTPAQSAFIVNPTTEFQMEDNDSSVAVYVGGVRQTPDSSVYTIDGTTNTVTLSAGVTNTTVMIIKNENAGSSISSLPGGAVNDILTRTANGAEWKAPAFDASVINSGTIDPARIPFATIQECLEGLRTDVLVDPRGYFLARAKAELNSWTQNEIANNEDFLIAGSTTFFSGVTGQHLLALKYGSVIQAPYIFDNFVDNRRKNTPFTNLTSITVDPPFQTASGIIDDQFILVSNEEGKIAYMSHLANQKETTPTDWANEDQNVFGDWTEIDTPATNGTLVPISGENWKCLQVEAVSLAGGVAVNSTDGLVSPTNINPNDNTIRYILENAFDIDAKINAIAKDSLGNYYFGGYFKYAGGVKANHIVKYTPSTNKFSPLGTATVGGGVACTTAQEVFAIYVDASNNVYAGGNFTSADGVATTANFAKFNGTVWSSMGTVNGAVNAIESDGTNLYIGGAFTSVNAIANTAYVAKHNGVSWSALVAGSIGGVVRAIKYGGASYIYIGGDFVNAFGTGGGGDYIVRYDGAAYNAVSSLTFNNSIYCIDINTDDNVVLVGGKFTQVSGLASQHKYAVGFNKTTGLTLTFYTLGYHDFNFEYTGISNIEKIAYHDGYVYIGGHFTDMNYDTTKNTRWSQRLGGMARFDWSKQTDFDLLVANAALNVDYPVTGLTDDKKVIVTIYNNTKSTATNAVTLIEGTDYSVDYENGTVRLLQTSVRLSLNDDLYTNLGWESLAGHGVFDSNYGSTDQYYTSALFVDTTDNLIVYGGKSGQGVLKYDPNWTNPSRRLQKFVGGQPIYYYALFEKPDGSEWRIYRTLKGNIISAANGYQDGYNPTNPTEIHWQLVDTISVDNHRIRPQIKAHSINPNIIKGTMIGWFVGKQFRFHRTPDTNTFTDDWDLSGLQTIDLDTTNTDIPADHHVAKWNSWAFNYADEDIYPQPSSVRNGIAGSLDVAGYGDDGNYRISHGMLMTDKGKCAYFTSFSSTFGSYAVPFRDTTFNGNQETIFDLGSSGGEAIACLATHSPNSEVSGSAGYGSRNLFVSATGYPLQQANRGGTGYGYCQIIPADNPSFGRIAAGCDFNYKAFRAGGATINFHGQVPSNVIASGKMFVQNDNADLIVYSPRTPYAAGQTNLSGQSQVSYHVKAFTSEYSPAPPMTVDKVVSNGNITLALVKGVVNCIWRLEDSDRGGTPITFTQEILDIFCEGTGNLSTFFVATKDGFYHSTDAETWTFVSYGYPIELSDNTTFEASFFDYGFGNYTFIITISDVTLFMLPISVTLYTKDFITFGNTIDSTGFAAYNPKEVTYCDFGNSQNGFVVLNETGELAKILDDDGSGNGSESGINVESINFSQWGAGITTGEQATAIQYSTNLSTLVVGTLTGKIFHTTDGTTFTQPTLTVDGATTTNLGGKILKLSGKRYMIAKVITNTNKIIFLSTANGIDWITFRSPANVTENTGNVTNNGYQTYYLGESHLNSPTGKLPVYYKVTL